MFGGANKCSHDGRTATRSLPRHPTVCICIRVGLCVHFCGSRLSEGGGGEGGGGGVEGFDVALEERSVGGGWCVCALALPLQWFKWRGARGE